MIRHATAALLNAAHDDVDFAYTEAEVIDIVQDAFATGGYRAARRDLAEANEAGCPLRFHRGRWWHWRHVTQ